MEEMISVEQYLEKRTNFELEKAVREYLILHPNWDTDDTGIIESVQPSYTLGTKVEFTYKVEFLDECFSDKNPNWKDGSLKHLINLAPHDIGGSNKFI